MLDQLEQLKKKFGPKDENQLSKLLTQLERRRIKDAASLIRLHESLMFILAYPQSKRLLHQAKTLLKSFPGRIEHLRKIEADLSPFDDSEIAGIAGTSLTVMLGYKFAQWITQHHPKKAEIDWEGYEDAALITAALPRLLPLLEEEALVEAEVPFLDYVRAAKPKSSTDLNWMMNGFSKLDITEKQKAELYESFKLYIHFTPDYKASRTGLALKPPSIFYHREPLIQRKYISLKKELSLPALKIEHLPAQEGKAILNIVRTASAVRYRELHGFIWADERSFLKVDLGRGVIIYLNEVSHENRLPLRAYHSGFIFKNGIPAGYVEGLSLFEQMEVGFNLYYTFRDGETAWLYAQLLRIFKQHLGITVFIISPYQIGKDNEEGIESGAFWFYRKLGFDPLNDEVTAIVEREEKKITSRRGYRTSPRILRKIAESSLIYVYEDDEKKEHESRLEKKQIQQQWKYFHLNNIMLAIQKRMSKSFDGDAIRMREITTRQISETLQLDLKKLSQTQQEVFSNLAVVLAMIPGLSKWTKEEKKLATQIMLAKGSRTEKQFLELMQKHLLLRDAMISMGSKSP